MFFICVLVLNIGFLFLIKGADLFVEGSAALVKNFRVPGLVIGLTIVAAGTSAPELAVSTVAALRGANEIALSNVVGSNIFNLLFILGISAVIHPVGVNAASVYDLGILFLASLLTLFFLRRGKALQRWEGFVMVGFYIADMIFVIVRK